MLLELSRGHLFSLAAMYTSGHMSHVNDALITCPGTGCDSSSNSIGSLLKSLPLKKRFSKRANASLTTSSNSNPNCNYNNLDHRTAKEFANFNLNCLKLDREMFEVKQEPLFPHETSLGVDDDEMSKGECKDSLVENNAPVTVKGEVSGTVDHATSDMVHLNPLNLLGSLAKSALECPESRHGGSLHHQVTRSYGKSRGAVYLFSLPLTQGKSTARHKAPRCMLFDSLPANRTPVREGASCQLRRGKVDVCSVKQRK